METAGAARSTPSVAIHSRREVVPFLVMLWCTSLCVIVSVVAGIDLRDPVV